MTLYVVKNGHPNAVRLRCDDCPFGNVDCSQWKEPKEECYESI